MCIEIYVMFNKMNDLFILANLSQLIEKLTHKKDSFHI